MHSNKIMEAQLGKLPPHDIEAEIAVLGAILLESKYAMSKVADRIKPEMFYKEEHELIMESIFELYKMRQPIDILTVTNQLKKTKNLDRVGGPYAIATITNKMAGARSIETHLMIITECHMRREIIRRNSQAIQLAYDLSSDVFTIIGDQQSNLKQLTEDLLSDDTENGYDLVDKTLAEIERIRMINGLSGITCGFDAIDDVTMGWQNTDLIIIAARPGMGKTAFFLSMVRKTVIRRKKKIGVISLEMSKIQLMKRLFSVDTEIKGLRIKGAKTLTPDETQLIATQSQNYAPYLLINDRSGLNIVQLRAIIRRMILEGAELIVIDYLQLLRGSKDYRGNREAEISEISRELKSIAKEFNVPIIALAQVSRETEKRKNKEPMLSDLRESGAIEQDADLVMFIHRPEYYGDDIDASGLSLKGVAQMIIAKHRNGPLDTILLHFEAETTAFEDRGFIPKQENNDIPF